MSKFLSSSYSPIVLEHSVMDIAHAVEQLTDARRETPIPQTDSGFVYNRILYSKLLSLITFLDGQTSNDRPIILTKTDITTSIVGSVVEKYGLEWGLIYSKEQRKQNGKNGKEVSLSNIKRYFSDLVVENVTIEIDSLEEYLNFVEAEIEYLNVVKKLLTPESIDVPKKGSSIITNKPVDKSELERFIAIAEKMKELQNTSDKEVNPDDLW